MKKLSIIIGANYGDEGKGLVTNSITPKNGIVVLSNGGAQRGHTVVYKNFKHIFHHFGSATLKSVPSYADSQYILNPIEFKREYEELVNTCGIHPRLYINPKCRVSTIFDMIMNTNRAQIKKDNSSTGFGILETIKRFEDSRIKSFTAEDFITDDTIWKGYLESIRDYYLDFDINDEIKNLLNDPNNLNAFINDLYFMFNHIAGFKDNLDIAEEFDDIVIENGQGLAIDISRDIVYGTPTSTGSENLISFLSSLPKDFKFDEINRYYVTRSYLTRHGDGSLPLERVNLKFKDDTNVPNEFQGTIRFALFESINNFNFLSRVASDASLIKANNNIVITHMNEIKLNIDFMKNLEQTIGPITYYVSDNREDIKNLIV